MEKGYGSSYPNVPEYHPNEGISEVHKYLMWMTKYEDYDTRDWDMIIHALEFAHRIHFTEMRKISRWPYFIHPLECIFDENLNHEILTPIQMCTILLHDTLETNPDCWEELFNLFGEDIFFHVYLLSSIGLKEKKMIFQNLSDMGKLSEIWRGRISILIYEGDIESHFPPGYNDYDISEFRQIREEYHSFLMQYCAHYMSSDKINEQILNLSNYLFYTPLEAWVKWRDTINNLSDVKRMPQKNRKEYMQRRIPKINILRYVLQKLGMQDHLNILADKWKQVGGGYDATSSRFYYFHHFGTIQGQVLYALAPTDAANDTPIDDELYSRVA